MDITLVSILLTGTISLLGVALSFYSINTQRKLALLAAHTTEFKAWADRLRSIVSDHISMTNIFFFAGDSLGPVEERNLVQRLTALEAEASILLLAGSLEEENLAKLLPELRRVAIRERDLHRPSPTEFTSLRDYIIELAGAAIRTRKLDGPKLTRAVAMINQVR